MKISDLLKMDMSQCIEWLIENENNFTLTPVIEEEE